jgi:hypothetical protein
MSDNNAVGGSTGEGSNELNTACHPSDISSGVSCRSTQHPGQIRGMKNSSGNVFGFTPPSGSGTL